MKESIRFSTLEDAARLAPILRQEDIDEVLAAGSPSPLAALQLGVVSSEPCLTVEDEDGHPCMMLGVAPTLDPEVGVIWLLSSDIIDRKPITFLRQSQKWLGFFHSRFPVLTNAVDGRNQKHITWLKWLGFTFINQFPGKGPGNHPFYEFVRVHHV